jgi:hypothetical protein
MPGRGEVACSQSEQGETRGETIVHTYQQLADAMGLTGKDPTRQCQRWAVMPGFPGRPATRGKRDGHFPVEKIKTWLAAQGKGPGQGYTSELSELRLQRERLKLEREIREEKLAAEQLADVDDVARHNARCVANAKAVLEPMADAVVGILPTKAPSAKQWTRVLKQVHSAVQRLLDDAYTEIEGMIVGDTDSTEDSE